MDASDRSPAAAQGEGPVKVVICGAGPAGLLFAHYLLGFGKGRFRVAIYDKAEDPGETLRQGLNHRRFTIGISKRGDNSISLVPGLAERVRRVSVVPDGISVLIPPFSRPIAAQEKPGGFRTWVADRFSLCDSLLLALREMHSDAVAVGSLRVRFRCPCTAVDLQSQLATFTQESPPGTGTGPGGGEVVTESYDLLVGADGLHSAVRMAFQAQIRGFELEVRKNFSTWVVGHFPCPEGFSKGTFHVFHVIPRSPLNGLAMPSPDGSLCFILSWVAGSDPHEWFACSTPAEAQEYLNSRLPHFKITEEAAWKLRTTPVQTNSQVKCWQYHDAKGHAVLIGDAAHATPPNIGQGCNASLVDASVLGRLLLGEAVGEMDRAPEVGQHQQQRQLWAKDPSPALVREKLPSILQRFSALQVPEGHALVDLSNSKNPLTPLTKVLQSVVLLVQGILSTLLPFLFAPPLITVTGETTTPYSTVYSMRKSEVDFFLWANGRYKKLWYDRESETFLKKKI